MNQRRLDGGGMVGKRSLCGVCMIDDRELDRFVVVIPEDEPVYPINIVCRLVHMQYWTIHELMKEGVLKPEKKKKAAKATKLFSQADINRLNYIRYLMDERGVNVKGVKVILEISNEER